MIFFEDLKQKYFEDILLSSGRIFVTRGGEMSGQQRLCVCNETLSVCKIKKEKFFFSVCVDEKFLQVRLPLSLHRNRCRLLLWNRILWRDFFSYQTSSLLGLKLESNLYPWNVEMVCTIHTKSVLLQCRSTQFTRLVLLHAEPKVMLFYRLPVTA